MPYYNQKNFILRCCLPQIKQYRQYAAPKHTDICQKTQCNTSSAITVKLFLTVCCSILFGRRIFLCPHYFYKIFLQKFYIFSSFVNSFFYQHRFCKRFLQHVALFSSKSAFSFPIFTLNTIPTRDFCNMLHFSLLNSPRSAKNAKALEAGKPASRAIKLKCQNELLYFSKLSLSSKKSYMFTVRIPYSS